MDNNSPAAGGDFPGDTQPNTGRKARAPLLVSLLMLSSLVVAQIPEPPRIIKEQNGKITNYRAEGSLASTQAINCIPLAEVKRKFTPPDLYKGVADCLAKNEYESAARLFALAGIYARFDAERVTDKTAGQARTVLIMNTFSNVPEDQKNKLNASLSRITKTPELLGDLCRELAQLGMPDYYPNYMILHGIRAFSGNPHDGALVANFDAMGTWKGLLSTYLHCPG